MLGLVLGIKDQVPIEDLATVLIAARHSGRLDNSLVDDLLDLTKGEDYIISKGTTRIAIINDMISRLMRSLVSQWIASYQKPVLTTTFTEEQVKLVDGHYDYTSGNRASRVLAKLLEYRQYLNRISK